LIGAFLLMVDPIGELVFVVPMLGEDVIPYWLYLLTSFVATALGFGALTAIALIVQMDQQSAEPSWESSSDASRG
jgi:hypothetical protein